MNFFDERPLSMPNDAHYYFNVCVINIAVRRSLGREFKDIWDLNGVCESRPFVYHLFIDEDETFEDDKKWNIEIKHHCVLEVSDSLGISYFVTDKSEEEFEDGEFFEPNDFWRF